MVKKERIFLFVLLLVSASILFSQTSSGRGRALQFPTKWYVDADRDSHGAGDPVEGYGRIPPSGYSLDSIDCDDENPFVHQLMSDVVRDMDGDWRYVGEPSTQCVGNSMEKTEPPFQVRWMDRDGQFTWLSVFNSDRDCDDSDSDMYPVPNLVADCDLDLKMDGGEPQTVCVKIGGHIVRSCSEGTCAYTYYVDQKGGNWIPKGSAMWDRRGFYVADTDITSCVETPRLKVSLSTEPDPVNGLPWYQVHGKTNATYPAPLEWDFWWDCSYGGKDIAEAKAMCGDPVNTVTGMRYVGGLGPFTTLAFYPYREEPYHLLCIVQRGKETARDSLSVSPASCSGQMVSDLLPDCDLDLTVEDAHPKNVCTVSSFPLVRSCPEGMCAYVVYRDSEGRNWIPKSSALTRSDGSIVLDKDVATCSFGQ